MKLLLITNNPLILETIDALKIEILYLPEVPLLKVMEKARDYVHLGNTLLTHPLSGSIKPNETPYKSILLGLKEKKINSTDHCPTDLSSLKIIEDSLTLTEKLINTTPRIRYPINILDEFKLIDSSLIKSGLDHLNVTI